MNEPAGKTHSSNFKEFSCDGADARVVAIFLPSYENYYLSISYRLYTDVHVIIASWIIGKIIIALGLWVIQK